MDCFADPYCQLIVGQGPNSKSAATIRDDGLDWHLLLYVCVLCINDDFLE